MDWKTHVIYKIGKWSNKIISHSTIWRLKNIYYTLYTAYSFGEFSRCGEDCMFMGFRILKGAKYIELGNKVFLGKDIIFECWDSYFTGQTFTPRLSFGDDSCMGDGGHISCINRVSIGNGVNIGKRVFITDNAHGASDRCLLDMIPVMRPLHSKGPVIIEDNVWVGEYVCIMPGVKIGRGSIIGANAVVTHDVPSYCVVGGNPAKIIKQL